MGRIEVDEEKSRTPRWVRGLKYDHISYTCRQLLCRTPRWVRGLKFWITLIMNRLNYRRTPRWVRGLKFCCSLRYMQHVSRSHPTMGAWIEITQYVIIPG